jgi:ketosteroid isomerase-like protein
VSEVTLFLTLYNAGVNGDFEAFADLIDDECEYVMVPTMEVSRGKPVILEAMGRVAGAFDRARRLPKVTFDAATSEFGVFEFVNEGTIASGIVDFAAHSDWQFSQSPAPSSDARTVLPSASCTA